MLSAELRAYLEKLRLIVFQSMGFINYQALPLNFFENRLVNDCCVIACNDSIELDSFLVSVVEFLLSNELTRLLIASIDNNIKSIRPTFKLLKPIVECSGWGNDQKGAGNLFLILEAIEERYRLDCFAKSHFICENNIIV